MPSIFSEMPLVITTRDSFFCNTPVYLHRAGILAKGQTPSILEFRFESSNKPFNAKFNANKL